MWKILYLVLLATSISGYSQDIKIPQIPKEWPLNSYNAMTSSRDVLVKHLKEYDRKVNDFNARCGSIKADNTALIAACQKESDQLDMESAAIDKERDRFLFLFHDYEKIYAAYVQTKINERLVEAVKKDSIAYNGQLQKLINDISKINVPPPPLPHKIHEGVMLGLSNTDDSNAVTGAKREVSAWTGKPYMPDEVFATSDRISSRELYRGLRDNNSLGEYTLSTEFGKKLIERLEGSQFDRLIAHSNGATVAEALIRKGTITVEELNIVGGDRSMVNGMGYRELIATGKVKRIVVWYNPSDIIPIGSSAALLLSPTVAANPQYINMATSYLSTLVDGRNQGGDTKVEYRRLEGNNYKEGQELKAGKDVFDAHGLGVYMRNIQTYFKGTDK